MSRPCGICTRPDRSDIDQALLAGASIRVLARQHQVSKDSISRHRAHVYRGAVATGDTATVRRTATDTATASTSTADSIIKRLSDLDQAAGSILKKSMKKGDFYAALRAISEKRRGLLALAEITCIPELQDELRRHSRSRERNQRARDYEF